MHLFVNVNVNLLDNSADGLRPTSTSSVNFDVVRDRTEDRLEILAPFLRDIADFVEENSDEVKEIIKSASSGSGDLRDKLLDLGLPMDAVNGDKNEAAKMVGLAMAIVAMPNDPHK